ncbi:MAG: DUF805 domain-containing protein [Henriciella sp.]|nr:DUF805 domain-containing protein [Henriciella sp.]
MGNLLFNPNGRIARTRFLQGMVVLTVASVLVVAGSTMVSNMVGFINLLLIFPYICVFGKRLHDAGTTAWWVIGLWLGSMLAAFILGLVFGGFFMTSEMVEIQEEMSERLAAGDFAGFMQGTEILSDKMLPLNILTTIGSNLILALVVGALKTEPRENKHGPVPGTTGPSGF